MIRPLICAVVFLLLSTSARADTFTLTAGSANTGFAQFSLFVSGPNIRIGGGAGLCTVPGCDAVWFLQLIDSSLRSLRISVISA